MFQISNIVTNLKELLYRCHANVVLQLKCGLRIVFELGELHHQTIFDGEHGVIIQIFGVCIEDLGCNGLVSWCEDLLNSKYMQGGKIELVGLR